VALDINDYQKRRANMLSQMALRFGEEVKKTGRVQTVGPSMLAIGGLFTLPSRKMPPSDRKFWRREMKKIAILPNERKESEEPRNRVWKNLLNSNSFL